MNTIRRATKRNFFIAQNMIFDLDISEHAKITYLYLSRCTDDESQAFPSYNTIAKKCSFSRMTAIRTIQELQKIGLLSVEKRTTEKNGKQINTSNLYTLYDSPEETVVENHPSITEIPPLVSESDHPSITEIPNKYPVINTPLINTQSISQSIKKNQSIDEPSTDRQTDFKKIKLYFKDKLCFDDLKISYPFETNLIDELELNLLEMYFSDYIVIKSEKKSQAIVRAALMKLTYSHIEDLVNKYKNLTCKITNHKAYIQTMIYNIAFESDLSITNEVQHNQTLVY